MYEKILYGKSHRRRPMWVGPGFQPDPQGAIPPGWCELCGREVFAPDEALCDRCMEKECVSDGRKSLFILYPGGRPGKM